LIEPDEAPVLVKTQSGGLYYSISSDWISFTWLLDGVNISHAKNFGLEFVELYNNFYIPNDSRPIPADSYEIQDNSSFLINTSLTMGLTVSTFSALEVQTQVGFVDSAEITSQPDYDY
jgi:hypothetical protein